MVGVDQIMSTRLQLRGTNKVKFAFVCSDGPHICYLFVGRQAKVEWISSGEPFIARSERDPNLVSLGKVSAARLAQDNPVDILIFEGRPPKSDDPVWDTVELKRLVWIDDTGRGRFKCGKKEGWRVHRRSISHAEIGGVTDAMFSVFLASRMEPDSEWTIPASGVRATLSRVVDPTKGGKSVDPPVVGKGSVEALNTALGLLQWKRRFDRVCVPTVYSKDKWALRRLSDVELADVLDLPGTMRKRMNIGQLAKLSKLNVPGKVMAAVIDSLVNLVRDEHFLDVKPALTCDGTSRKRPGEEVLLGNNKRINLGDTRHVATGCENEVRDVSFAEVCDELNAGGSPEKLTTVADNAVKSDDAPAPEHLFDRRVLEASPFVAARERGVKNGGILGWEEALRRLRRFSLRIWKRKVRREYIEWLSRPDREAFTSNEMKELGWDACRRVDGASFWEWDSGSTPLFWRWPRIYQRDVWEGAPPRFVSTPPMTKEAQPPYDDLEVRAKVSAKLQKVVDRGYIEIVNDPDRVKSFMFMFDVPKGDSDIRMVYDGSRSGFDESIWAPWFALPTVETMTRTVWPGGWCGDRDFGEMFLNFMLHPEARVYCGVDLSQLDLDMRTRAPVEGTSLMGCWTRNAMGLRSSPYLSVQAVTRIKRAFLGDTTDRENPFHWETVIVNLPGSEGYDPSSPWISKLRHDQRVAADLHIYIDDVRITGPSKELVWSAGSRVAKLCSFFGLQDAPRKLREPSQTPGAWAGSVVATEGGSVKKFVTDEQWGKTQRCVRWIASKLGIAGDEWSLELLADEDEGRVPNGKLPHKQAERIRGFLIYVSRTYTAMVPYLKGLHLTLDFWRGRRDEEGWKILGREEEGEGDQAAFANRKAPRFVSVAPRLYQDVEVL